MFLLVCTLKNQFASLNVILQFYVFNHVHWDVEQTLIETISI